jgi:YHS domain-containing protein
MKTLLTTITISMLLMGCGGGSHTGSGKALDVTPDKLAVKVDPVCQMKLDQHPIADTMTYKGNLYGFCSSGCKDAFAANPESFLAALPK